jgi:hypothetical protein
MKKVLLMMGLILLAVNAQAKVEVKNDYLVVSGEDTLKDHSINQADDTSAPPQGYIVKLPKGYSLASVDVVSNELNVCGVSKFDYKNQIITIEGFHVEYDAEGCNVILTIDGPNKMTKKVTYYIEQVGS